MSRPLPQHAGAFETELDSQLNDLLSNPSSLVGGGASASRSAGRMSLVTPSTGSARTANRPRPTLSGPKRLSYRTPVAPTRGGDRHMQQHDDDGMDFGAMDDGGGMEFEDLPRDNPSPSGFRRQSGGEAATEATNMPKSRFAKQQTTVKAIEAVVPAASRSGIVDPNAVTITGLEINAEDLALDPYAISVAENGGSSKVRVGLRSARAGGREVRVY